jgi:hypothetical protein
MIDVVEILKDADWNKKKPAKAESLRNLIEYAPDELPKEYLALLQYSDGGEGKINLEIGWFMLWSSTDVVELNKGYEIDVSVQFFL